FMFEDDAIHDEKFIDSNTIMQEGEKLAQQDEDELDCLSELEECFNEEDPMEITTFAAITLIPQQKLLSVMEENIREQPTTHDSPPESDLEDLDEDIIIE
ncbi:hypothetical protein KI387_016031, partial [Taxus chinensis]